MMTRLGQMDVAYQLQRLSNCRHRAVASKPGTWCQFLDMSASWAWQMLAVFWHVIMLSPVPRYQSSSMRSSEVLMGWPDLMPEKKYKRQSPLTSPPSCLFPLEHFSQGPLTFFALSLFLFFYLKILNFLLHQLFRPNHWAGQKEPKKYC